ncbi:hypothetical protein C437_15361 [Haloarcula vallismortis ATCC 29715]|uniref:DUF8053 domain-containing protein n=1 Tax=Haloarcula vallismortis ATCC 29715 TaxID=662477 RepID=M0J245_HALVA|nr:hypothetical protein [Haloarcula vallismortis]EMA01810.1 hypothetical protein C437_15361 [Haloarcula vallismortis ATCC 29715]
MANIHQLRRIGSNSSGDKVGVELPRDDIELEGLLDENGELTDTPQVAISRVDDGEWRIERLGDQA